MQKPQAGQVIYSIAGYDASIARFFKVVSTTEKSVRLIEVGKGVTEASDGPTRFVVPLIHREIGKPFTRKVRQYEEPFPRWWSVKINDYTFAQDVFTAPVAETAPGWY